MGNTLGDFGLFWIIVAVSLLVEGWRRIKRKINEPPHHDRF